jgi:hypothetical protein
MLQVALIGSGESVVIQQPLSIVNSHQQQYFQILMYILTWFHIVVSLKIDRVCFGLELVKQQREIQ